MNHEMARFAVCLSNADYMASLEARKIYAVVPDADAEALGFLRIVDESGEDYLYTADLFGRVKLSPEAEQSLMARDD